MPTKDVYFLSKFENKTTSYCLKKYGLNYDTNLCNQLSQHSIRAFIPIRKHEMNLVGLHLRIKGQNEDV